MAEDKAKLILDFAEKKGLLVNSGAVQFLSKREDFEKILEQLAEENEFIISEEIVERKTIQSKIEMAEQVVEVKKTNFKPNAKEIEPNFRIMEEFDVTNKTRSRGKVKDFVEFFQNRFNLLKGMLEIRQGFVPKPISRLRTITAGNEFEFVGMVYRKWITKNGHMAFELEDLDSRIIAIISKNDLNLWRIGDTILLDNVVGVKCKKISEELVGIKEVLWPDVPMRPAKLSERDVSIAGISDIHMGSKLFLEKPFKKFLEWLNGRTELQKDKDIVGKIKYLVIVGDNVDGIGIYPTQAMQLNIKDIFEQYDAFAKLLLQIPEYIEIFVIPGQHDAVRWADPMPAIPKKFVPRLDGAKNIHFIGSPGWIEIESLKVLLYHGASLHDLHSSISSFNAEHPEKGMIELLRRRDLMPSYGLKQPYVPEKENYLTLKEVPDIFFTGDMHHNGYDSYRGVSVINTGTWQSRTDYQVKLGHIPTPGNVPVVELATRKISEYSFYSGPSSMKRGTI